VKDADGIVPPGRVEEEIAGRRWGSRSEWGVTERNREARFYSLTVKGRRQLALEQESWGRLTKGVGRVLRYA
jgi:hypothetical protein